MMTMDVFNKGVSGSSDERVDCGDKPPMEPSNSSLFPVVMYIEENVFQINKHDESVVAGTVVVVVVVALRDIDSRNDTMHKFHSGNIERTSDETHSTE
jgi:hypothetical protein